MILEAVFGPSQPTSASSHWISRSAGVETWAGVLVNEDEAMRLTAVSACISLIADAKAQLPINIMQQTAKGVVRRREHPLQQILNRAANPHMTAFIQQETTSAHTLGWGNGYCEIVRNNAGRVMELWPLLPDRTRPIKDNGELLYQTVVDGEMVTLPARDVLHIPAKGFDGLVGHSPIYMHRQTLGLALAAEEFGARFFGQGTAGGGFLQHPSKLSDPAYARLKEWASQRTEGLDNANRLKILEEGMTFQANTVPPEEAQFIATRQMQVEEVARIYRVPLHLLSAKEGTSNWGTGIESIGRGFVTYTLGPWIERDEQEMDRKLFTESERRAGYHVRYDVRGLTRGDLKTRAEFYAKAVGRPWLTVDEARELEDMEPIGIETVALQLNTTQDGSTQEPAET